MNEKIKWGLIGYGKFGKRIEQAFSKSHYSKLDCIASKSFLNDNQNKFSQDKKTFYNAYEDLIKNKNIKNIYIATTNNLHKELIISAAKNKKNIICEKPACLNEKDFTECISVIKKNNVFFMEGLMYLHHPQINETIKMIKNNEIGKINKIICNFGYRVGKKFLMFELKKIDTKSRLFNSNLGGGAIYDLGCYPLTAALLFFRINQVDNKILNHEFFREDGKYGVDESAKTHLTFECGGVAELRVSIRKDLDNVIEIFGTKGNIKVLNPWIAPSNSAIEINKNNKIYRVNNVFEKDIYSLEIDNASEAIYKNQTEVKFPKINIDRSLEYIKIMDRWKTAILK